MSDYPPDAIELPDGIEACRFCGALHAYVVGPDGEVWAEAGYHRPDCPDACPEKCPF